MRAVLVTGTSTGVGKTIVSAVLAARASEDGWKVTVVKPVQTGADAGDSDAAEITRLSGLSSVQTCVTLGEPLAPDTAARRAGQQLPSADDLADQCIAFATGGNTDLVVVEGAGGLLVRLDTDGGTLLTMADRLAAQGHPVSFVVVTTLTLGTLNHTELTAAAITARGHVVAGLVIGSVPADPDLAESCNLGELTRVTGLPVLAAVPAEAAQLAPAAFREQARLWMAQTAWLTADAPGQR